MSNPIVLTIVASLFSFSLIGFIMAVLIRSHKKMLKHVIEKKNIEDRFNKLLLESQIEIQEQTLKNIAEEIHDNIGQVLSLSKLTLSSINTEGLQETKPKIDTVKKLINTAIVDLKSISNSLSSSNVHYLGLIPSLQNAVDNINRTNLKANLAIEGTAKKLDAKTELILFRMAQECINNTIKHAQATSINIIAKYTNNHFELSLLDNGKGFDTNIISAKGIGLLNIQNRVKLLHGTASIYSNNGTAIHIKIPNQTLQL